MTADTRSGVVVQRGKQEVSCVAVGKSGRVLYAFSMFYLPFYGLEPSDIFWHYDLFACISALVYDIDEDVEFGLTPEYRTRRIDELSEFLKARIAFDSKVACLLREACRYYDFEHNVVRMGGCYTFDDLVEVTAIRSFDFRLMHRALAQMSGVEYRERLFGWFRAFEMLMEIDDDIVSMEDDSERCTFNIASLALRASPEAGVAFVLRAREQVEMAIDLRMGELTEAERDRCRSTLAAYRSVVPTPTLSMSADR